MSVCAAGVTVFDTREAAAERLAVDIAAVLRDAVDAKGKASLMLSGGSTPAGAYEALSAQDVEWPAVTVGLVDERWVPADDPRSNEGLVRRTLLRGPAARATFLPMTTSESSPFVAGAEISERYAAAMQIDAVVLGMGLDGHTASWFAGAPGVARAMDPTNADCAAPVDATGSPVAGDCPLRMTLTASAIGASRRAFLLLFGEDKRAVYDAALADPASELPIAAAARLLGERLHLYWAP